MGSQEFDRRYPAMFQPGGEGEAGELFVPSPLPARERRAPGQPHEMLHREPPPGGAGLHRGHIAERTYQPEALAPEAFAPEAFAPEDPAPEALGAGSTDPDGPDPGARNPASTDPHGQRPAGTDPHGQRPAGSAEARSPARVLQWSARTWTVCLSAILLTLAGSAFCLLATQFLPGAASVDPTENRGMMVAPWGTLILPGASALLTAALGMLAGLFLTAARHYTARAWWLQGAAAAVGLAAVGGACVGMFSELLFAETLYNPRSYEESYYLPWFIVFQQAAWQLLLLGLVTLALVVIIRPRRNRAPGAPSAGGALWTGLLMTGAGLWCWFALQLYPLVEGRTVTVDEQYAYSMQPWTNIINQAGGPLVMVGSAALFWWVFILASTRSAPEEPAFDDQREHGGHHEPA